MQKKYDSNKKYICDICVCASAWGEYPESVVAKSGRYIQMVHADYVRAKEVNFTYNKWHKTTEHVGVSEHVCKIFKKLLKFYHHVAVIAKRKNNKNI